MPRSVTHLIKIFKTSVASVHPIILIDRYVRYNSIRQELAIDGVSYDLQNKNVYLVGAGKAVQTMARELANILNDKIKYGIISIPAGSLHVEGSHDNIHYYEGAENNLPDDKAVTTANKIRELAAGLGSNDVLLVLISGGGSALLPLPKLPITLDEKTKLIKYLANAGADIKELNTVRKRLSDLKGGQLAITAQPAKVISLIISDIVGNPIDLIASGPTAANKDNPNEALGIINKYKLFDELPESIKSVLKESTSEHEFPSHNVSNHLIGSNSISSLAALAKACSLHYLAVHLSENVTGNLKTVASEYVKLTKLFCDLLKGNVNSQDIAFRLASLNIPGISTNLIRNLQVIDKDALNNRAVCVILSGEITVEVKGTGTGGRNQHLALEFSNLIAQCKREFHNFSIYLLSAGTDGIDGPTDAAGAIGYLKLISDAEQENLNVQEYLNNNDSYNFYKKFKNGTLHVKTGHTDTNVMDIHVLIIKRKH